MENAGWLSLSAQEALRIIGDSQVEERRRAVSAGTDLPDRLLRAFGGRGEPIREVLGQIADGLLPSEAEPRQIAELALAIHGAPSLFRVESGLARCWNEFR